MLVVLSQTPEADYATAHSLRLSYSKAQESSVRFPFAEGGLSPLLSLSFFRPRLVLRVVVRSFNVYVPHRASEIHLRPFCVFESTREERASELL